MSSSTSPPYPLLSLNREERWISKVLHVEDLAFGGDDLGRAIQAERLKEEEKYGKGR
jgi:hypothetical protein